MLPEQHLNVLIRRSLNKVVSVLRPSSVTLKHDVVVHDNVNEHPLDLVRGKKSSRTIERAGDFVVGIGVMELTMRACRVQRQDNQVMY